MRRVWTYFVTRDSLSGDLSGVCDLWWIKPIRVVHQYRVTWVAVNAIEPGHLGVHFLDDVLRWFRVAPDTDREMIRVEQWATEDKK